MTRILVAKKLNALHPIDDAGAAVFRGITPGEIVSIELKRPRNLKHHRKFFAMLQIVLENQDYYKSLDDLLDVCKLAVGHCRTVMTKHGPVRIPESISFAAMDQSAFDAFYDRVVVWVAGEVIPGLERRDLDEEVRRQLLSF